MASTAVLTASVAASWADERKPAAGLTYAAGRGKVTTTELEEAAIRFLAGRQQGPGGVALHLSAGIPTRELRKGEDSGERKRRSPGGAGRPRRADGREAGGLCAERRRYQGQRRPKGRIPAGRASHYLCYDPRVTAPLGGLGERTDPSRYDPR